MSDPLFAIEGKRVFLTGGGAGIGRMLTEGLASRGARIFTCSRKQNVLDELVADLRDGQGFDVTTTTADLSDMAQVERVAQEATAHFGGSIDVLINNSGATWGDTLDDFPLAGWDRCFDLNVKALFRLTQLCLPALRAAGTMENPARIVNFGSVAGDTPVSNAWAYHPAKAAVHHLSRSLALHLAGDHVTVNAVAPGLFPSRMTKHLMPEGDDSLAAATVPMRRVGTPEDIVGTIIYLISRAGAYTTGAVITVDGAIRLAGGALPTD